MRRQGLVLVPVEFSDSSKTALRYAIDLARSYDSRLVVLHVIDAPPLVWSFGRMMPQQTPPEEPEESRSGFDAWLVDVDFKGVEHDDRFAKGPPGQGIVRAARELRADAIVLASHGETGWQAWLGGGVALQVLREARCPVVSIKSPGLSSRLGRMFAAILPGESVERAADSFPPRTILHATDFSESCRNATNLAARIAGATGAGLVLLHVDPSDSPGDSARAELDQVCKQATAQAPGIEPVVAMRHGGAASGILEHAAAVAADLIVMGTEGLGGLSVLSVGSTAGRVLRQATCPVMTLCADTTLRRIDARFKKVYSSLSATTLRAPDEGPVDNARGGDLLGAGGSDLFLGFYTRKGFVLALEEYGIYERLRAKGFDGLRTTFDLRDTTEQSFTVHFDDQEDRDHLLIEATLAAGSIRIARPDLGEERTDYHAVLLVPWLCLQNPRAEFNVQRPRMPAQVHPGLGMGRELLAILSLIAVRLGKEGLVNHPMQLHNASYYHPMFRFLDPVVEGRFAAILRDTADATLADASWAVHLGCVLDASTGEPARWEGREQVYPLSPALQEYFESEPYRTAVWNTARKERFVVDWERFRARISAPPGG